MSENTTVDQDVIDKAVVAGNTVNSLQKALPKEGWFDGKMDLDEFSEYVENFGGNKASGWGSALDLFEIPAGKQYRIRERDGYEWLEYPEDIKWEVAD